MEGFTNQLPDEVRSGIRQDLREGGRGMRAVFG